MTERQLENRLKKLQALEAQKKELEEQAEALKAEIKADMESKGLDELKTKNFTVRWKEVASNRFDSTSFKKQYNELYKQFTKVSCSKRFTVA